MQESASLNALNPAFGFNAFGYAPPGLTPANPAFGQQVSTPLGAIVGTVEGYNALQGIPAAPIAHAVNPNQMNPDINYSIPTLTPHALDPNMHTLAPTPQQQFSQPPTPTLNDALLGMLADQQSVQQAMQNLSLAPPQGYMDAFNAPMTMSQALDATVAAMNPSMSADDTSGDTSGDSGNEGGGQGGIGSEGGGGGIGGGGSTGGIGSEGGGGIGGGGSTGGIGSEGGGGGIGGGGSTGGIGSEGGGGGIGGGGSVGGIGSEGGGGGAAGAEGGGGEGGE